MTMISHIVRGGLIVAGCATLGAAAIGAGSAAADPPAKKPAEQHNCFFITQWRGWKSPSPDVIYLGVNLHDVYKVTLSTPSNQLQWPDVHLVSKSRGSDTVCDALDPDLTVADDHGGVREALIATSITKLTKEEVAAIPPKFRPN